jgi:hypothetical protein
MMFMFRSTFRMCASNNNSRFYVLNLAKEHNHVKSAVASLADRAFSAAATNSPPTANCFATTTAAAAATTAATTSLPTASCFAITATRSSSRAFAPPTLAALATFCAFAATFAATIASSAVPDKRSQKSIDCQAPPRVADFVTCAISELQLPGKCHLGQYKD